MTNQPLKPNSARPTSASGSLSEHQPDDTSREAWPDLPGLRNTRRAGKSGEADDPDLPATELPFTAPPLPPTGSGAPYSPYLQPRSQRSTHALVHTSPYSPTYLQPRSARQAPMALVPRHAAHTMQECPNCGSMQPTSTSVCMACGAFFPATPTKTIRCRRCGTQASSSLSICPGCGRTLQAAPSRLFGWLVPTVLVACLLLLLQQWNQVQPVTWAETQFNRAQSWIGELGERLDPQITISTLPAAVTENLQTQRPQSDAGLRGVSGVASVPVPLSQVTAAEPSISSLANGEAVAATVVDATATVFPASNPDLPIVPTTTAVPAIVTATAIVPATATVTATPTAAATATAPPSTNTATPIATEPVVTAPATVAAPPRPATVVAGQPTPGSASGVTNRTTSILLPTDTPVLPAAKLALATARSTTPATVTEVPATAIPATATSMPTVTPTVTPTPTVAPTVPPTLTPTTVVNTVYVIKSGDTPSSIAAIYGIGINELLTANGLGIEDARRLRVGQELVIPTAGQPLPTATALPPTAAPTAANRVTAAPNVPTAIPATTIRLDAPQLRSPESGAFLSCGGNNSLTWLPVTFIRGDDSYLLHLGFVNGYNTDNTEAIVWVLEQQQPANVTIWRMDESLCSLAPQEFGRQWRWYVEVVDATGDGRTPVSLSSAIWAFSWN